MNKIAIVILALLLVPLSLFLSGFTLSTLWNWFIPAVVPTLGVIGIWQAAGLALLVNYLTYTRRVETENEKKLELYQKVLLSFIEGLIVMSTTLVLGLLVKLFM